MSMLAAVIAVTVMCAVVLALVSAPLLSQARLARRVGVAVSPLALVGMQLRKVDGRAVIEAAGRLRAAGVEVPHVIARLETHLIAGGDLRRVCDALIAAEQDGLEATYFTMTGLDLARVDPLRALEAMKLARAAGWPLTCEEAMRVADAGHDPVEYVRAELARSPARR